MFTAPTARRKDNCHAVSHVICCGTTIVSAKKYVLRTTIGARSGRMQTVCGVAVHWQLLAKWILLEKLTVPRLVKVLTVCYVTQRLVTPFTEIRHLFLFWARLIQFHAFPFYSCTPVSTVETADDFDAVTVRVVVVVTVVVVAFWECRQVGNRTFISRLSRKYRPIARPLAAAKTQAMLQ